jgi:hypothetical protein
MILALPPYIKAKLSCFAVFLSTATFLIAVPVPPELRHCVTYRFEELMSPLVTRIDTNIIVRIGVTLSPAFGPLEQGGADSPAAVLPLDV